MLQRGECAIDLIEGLVQTEGKGHSLIETAKANNLEPSAYIGHVLEHLAEADSLEKLEALLPWNIPVEAVNGL